MSAKTTNEVIASIQTIRLEIEAINRKRSSIAKKVVQLEIELNQYLTERDALEAEQSEAARLLISGEMTDEQFNSNRRKLSELYEAIDSATEREAIYRNALDQQSARRLSELNELLSAKTKILAGLQVKEIAMRIASENGQALRQLAALIYHHNPNQIESFSQLGKVLAGAVFGESNGNPLHIMNR